MSAGPVVERVAVVGLGLLGGSVALAARARGVAREVVGATRSARRARPRRCAAGAVDRIAAARARSRAARISSCSRRRSARWPRACCGCAALDCAEGCVVTDVGSVKAPLVETLPGLLPPGLPLRRLAPDGGQPPARHGARARGSVRGRGLHRHRGVRRPPRARAWWRSGRRSARASCGAAPRQHDAEVAWVSHLPHLLAFAFAGVAGRGTRRRGRAGRRGIPRLHPDRAQRCRALGRHPDRQPQGARGAAGRRRGAARGDRARARSRRRGGVGPATLARRASLSRSFDDARSGGARAGNSMSTRARGDRPQGRSRSTPMSNARIVRRPVREEPPLREGGRGRAGQRARDRRRARVDRHRLQVRGHGRGLGVHGRGRHRARARRATKSTCCSRRPRAKTGAW